MTVFLFTLACSILVWTRCCFGLAQNRPSPTSLQVDFPIPSRQDELLEQWYMQHGILGTDCVKVRTTPHSVAGRGLFYYNSSSANSHVEKGHMLAIIPTRCVLSRQTIGHYRQWPDLQHKMELLTRQGKFNWNDDWPAALTEYARRALHDKHDNNNINRTVDWSTWIQTWRGPVAPRAPDLWTRRELQSLAEQSNASEQEIRTAIQVRFEVYQRHCAILDALGSSTTSHSCKDDHDVLYGTVLSRAANLGPRWNYESGIVPMQDMLNHPNYHYQEDGVENNVELFTVGDIARQTSREHVTHLARVAFSNDDDDDDKNVEVITRTIMQLQDTDVVLVARHRIGSGEELLLSYTGGKKELHPKEQVWKMLQYGFCLA